MTQPDGTFPRNPYSPTAVARALDEGTDGEPITVETPAFADARRHLAAYLDPRPGELAYATERDDGTAEGPDRTTSARAGTVHPPGMVLAVAGDYGTGKTHLAGLLLREARRTRDHSPLVVHQFYLEGSVGSFEKLYLAFASKLQHSDLLETVRDYYADVVAKALDAADFTRPTAQRLRDRELDPDSVIAGLGLVDSRLVRELRQSLIDVTDREEFGIALTMLLRRPEFVDDIWAWLTGAPPSPALEERGITAAISGDEMALAAMGVFAKLYRRRNHRLVVVIDELEKLLAGPHRFGPHPAGPAFQKLFEVSAAAGAFLVAVSLPDLFDVLDKGESQRIGHRVDMPKLTGDDVRRLMRTTHREVLHRDTIAPFTPDTPDVIAKLANGTVRQVIRLCHLSFQLYLQREAGKITSDLVREAARSADDTPTVHNAKNQIRRQLMKLGHTMEVDYWPMNVAEPVDLWITVGTRRAGCAIIVAASVVSDQDARRLQERASAIRSQVEGAQTLLVVTGFLSNDLRTQLKDAFDRDPLEYSRYDFAEELTAAVTAAVARVKEREEEDLEARVLDRLTLINQQHAYTYESIEALGRQVAELRSSVDARLATAPPAAEPTPLPTPVARVFQHALDAITDYSATEATMRGALSIRAAAAARADNERALRRWLADDELYPAIGTISLLRQLVEAFRAGVVDWYTHRQPDAAGPGAQQPAGAPAAVSDRELTTLCQSYEAIYYHLPLARLDDYRRGVTRGRGHDLAEEAAWAGRYQAVRSHLNDLGLRIQQTLNEQMRQDEGGG